MMKPEIKKIRETNLFSCLSTQEIEKLFQDTPIVAFNKNETIYKQESYASHAFYLLEGFAKIYIEHKSQIQTVNIIKPNWFVGLFSNFSYEKHAFSAKAITDIKVILIPRKKLENTLKSNPEFAVRYIKSVSLLGTDISLFLALLNKKNVRGRIAEILYHLSQNIYQTNEFELGFTRQELGNLANTSTETVIRIFSELKKEGIIDSEKKGIKINDIQRLKKIIEISS